MSSEIYSLEDLLEITSSKRIHAADYVPSGIPFYRSKEVIERANGAPISTELFINPEQYHNIKKKFEDFIKHINEFDIECQRINDCFKVY